MSNDINAATNLIDLSGEDGPSSPLVDFTPSKIKTCTAPKALLPIPHCDGRESLENNPFDFIQKQANRPDDPFELLSREASYQAHPFESAAAVSQAEVRTENLLWISDDSIKIGDDDSAPVSEFSKLQVPFRFREPISSLSSIGSTNFSPGNDSAFTSRNDSSKTVNKAFITENTISSLSEDSQSQSLMNKGFVGSFSSLDVSQSSGSSTPECSAAVPDNADSSGRGRSQKVVDARKRLLKLSLSNSTSNSPLNRRPFDEENSSPLSSVFSEAKNLADHFSSQFVFDTTKSFDDSCDDLMAIKPNWIDSETDIDSDLELMKIPILQEIPSPVVSEKAMPWDEEPSETERFTLPTICKNSSDLEALKEKVQQHKVQRNNNHEIGALIENLKHVIKDCANDTKKTEANNLLESLSNLMNDKNVGETNEKMNTLTPPQPIVRQGTFDIDLKENEEREEREKQEAQQTHQEAQHREPHCSVEEPPQEEPEHCSDPNISGRTHSFHSPEISQPEVSDIVEQIGRLLSNQNVNVVQANISNSSGNGNGTTNPTYIVVMNTPIPTKQRPSITPSDYRNDGSPELSQSQGRRRSQSLSIHDKEKQFTAPEPPSTQRNECRTPARATMIRRNSFSSATSSTPSTQINRRSIYSNSNATDSVTKPQSQMPRRSMALETHHEKQHIIQSQPPMQIGGIGLNAKKLKFKQSTESIFKASGPMKATIPVKKVAPMIVTTTVDSPIEDSSKFKSATSTPNVQLAAKSYPNACSTPMVEASPIKRIGIPKSRYSFVAATPTPKQSSLAPSTSSQVRRRTMSEMRSPKKVIEKPSSSGISKPPMKSVKLPQNFSKTLNKMAPSTSKGVLRLTKPATFPSTADKNKENKLPRTGR